MSLRVLVSATVSYLAAVCIALAVVFGSILALLLATPLFIYIVFRVLKLERQISYPRPTHKHEARTAA